MTTADSTYVPTKYGPEYSDDGVDLSLIRWMLSMTPAERLAFLQQRINDILTIRKLNGRT